MKKIMNYFEKNIGKVFLCISVTFCILFIILDLSTDCIINHNSKKVYNKMQQVVEENKDEIILLSNCEESKIQLHNGDNIEIDIQNNNIQVTDTVYIQNYTIETENGIKALKKMNENMFLSKSGLGFCFIFFIALPVGASLAFIFIFLLVLSIIAQMIKCMQKK